MKFILFPTYSFFTIYNIYNKFMCLKFTKQRLFFNAQLSRALWAYINTRGVVENVMAHKMVKLDHGQQVEKERRRELENSEKISRTDRQRVKVSLTDS